MQLVSKNVFKFKSELINQLVLSLLVKTFLIFKAPHVHYATKYTSAPSTHFFSLSLFCIKSITVWKILKNPLRTMEEVS